VIFIDLPADLNMEDDQQRTVARLADAVDPDAIRPGCVVVAGSPGGWSWAMVKDIEDGFVYFRQVSSPEPADR
jgi:hypothetical protein